MLALHGCLHQSELIGNRWVTEAGINEWADTNALIVLYPDTIATAAPAPTNPNGCFDWWGYSKQVDPNYALKRGLQLSVLYSMVQRWRRCSEAKRHDSASQEVVLVLVPGTNWGNRRMSSAKFVSPIRELSAMRRLRGRCAKYGR